MPIFSRLTMFSPHKQSGTHWSTNSPSKRASPNGLFKDGIWLCNCEPRLPASHFQVKKEGKNRGKWFYTCQQAKDIGCGFFLWDDNATGREKQVVMNNTRSEIDEMKTHADASKDKRFTTGPPAVSKTMPVDQSSDSEDEFGDFSFSQDDINSVVDVAERASTTPGKTLETPTKIAAPSIFATPGTKRKWGASELPTPFTAEGASKRLFGTPAKRLTGGVWDDNEPFKKTPNTMHTPSPFRDAGDGDIQEQTKYDITGEVMEALDGQQLDQATVTHLRQLLSRHALKMSGIVKGRDISRVALKTKDAKIAELQQKITALETEREMDKTVIKHFKSDMSRSIATKGAKGRGKH